MFYHYIERETESQKVIGIQEGSVIAKPLQGRQELPSLSYHTSP
jgi:hypothetical protein